MKARLILSVFLVTLLSIFVVGVSLSVLDFTSHSRPNVYQA